MSDDSVPTVAVQIKRLYTINVWFLVRDENLNFLVIEALLFEVAFA